jgi:multisubunit Na+/H+ antiporter MnhB subunit
MKPVILAESSRFLHVGFVLLSIWVLYRGHNLPGGGFIGGLLLASAFILTAMSSGYQVALRRLRIKPTALVAIGLLTCLVSGLPAIFLGFPFMKALWLPTFSLPLLGTVHLGTPLVFDAGVYLAVAGFCLKVFFSFMESNEEEIWNS